MPRAARLGDPISHGGQIITASPDTKANGIDVARLGDTAACALHGLVSIVSASGSVKVNGRGKARVGDVCSCGAFITSGSADVEVG
ncbi:MAG: PAAR domain-containing protein [Aeromicrobium sp.]